MIVYLVQFVTTPKLDLVKKAYSLKQSDNTKVFLVIYIAGSSYPRRTFWKGQDTRKDNIKVLLGEYG